MPEGGEEQLLMVYKVKYGTSAIGYSASRSDRKTLAIEVHLDLSIKVIAPLKATLSAVAEKILKRAQWIRKQQHYFEQFLPCTPSANRCRANIKLHFICA